MESKGKIPHQKISPEADETLCRLCPFDGPCHGGPTSVDMGMPLCLTQAVYTVVFPNYLRETGMAVPYQGALKVYEDRKGGLGILPVLYRPQDIVFLDPRVIVFNDSQGTVDYSPRYFDESRFPDFREWLQEHPFWGIPGCESDWEKALSEKPRHK